MTVFFDFYEIALGKGKSIGIYNYAFALLTEFSKRNNDFKIVVACSGENYKYLERIPNIKLKQITISYPSFFQRIIWRVFKAIRNAKAEEADIYYSPKGFAPGLIKRKSRPFIVLTVHDMIPFYYLYNFPNYFTFLEKHYVTKSLMHSLKIANRVITISHFSKKMIDKFSNADVKVNVVYNGISVPLNGTSKNEVKPYIFSITSVLPHKNHQNLIDGYLEYRRNAVNPLPLKICGIKFENLNISTEYNSVIECFQYADNDKFANLFKNASLFLFLPRIEGFGFPPLESLMYGVPSIVSNIPVLREILGQSAYFVNQEDYKEIAISIENVLKDSSLKENILSNALSLSSKYTWHKTAEQIVNVFNEIV